MTGHVKARTALVAPTPLSQAALDLLCVDMPEADMPEAPSWTPKVQCTPQGTTKPSFPPPLLHDDGNVWPEAPAWTPKVSPCGASVQGMPMSFPVPQAAVNLQHSAPNFQMQAMPATLPMCNTNMTNAAAPVQHTEHRSEHSFFRVACPSGIVLRTGPHFDAARTGTILVH